jgi:hypothetical protein
VAEADSVAAQAAVEYRAAAVEYRAALMAADRAAENTSPKKGD